MRHRTFASNLSPDATRWLPLHPALRGEPPASGLPAWYLLDVPRPDQLDKRLSYLPLGHERFGCYVREGRAFVLPAPDQDAECLCP